MDVTLIDESHNFRDNIPQRCLKKLANPHALLVGSDVDPPDRNRVVRAFAPEPTTPRSASEPLNTARVTTRRIAGGDQHLVCLDVIS